MWGGFQDNFNLSATEFLQKAFVWLAGKLSIDCFMLGGQGVGVTGEDKRRIKHCIIQQMLKCIIRRYN